jgi:hypothetical protein
MSSVTVKRKRDAGIEILRTRRRLHICMQDDQIGPKIVGLAPADRARLPPSIITKKKYFCSKQSSQSAGTTPNLKLPCFTWTIVCFILVHYPSSS